MDTRVYRISQFETQFVCVAEGIQKRLEANLKNRRSSRLASFDSGRNITECESPKAPVLSDAQQMAKPTKQKLNKWKEERDKKRKEAAAQKKKPFVVGISRKKTFGTPPPLPMTSKRVTRSQARQKAEPKPSKIQAKSFAPSNAAFKPHLIFKSEVPMLAPVNHQKVCKEKTNITVVPLLLCFIPAEDTKKKPNDTTKINQALARKKPPLLKHQDSSYFSQETASMSSQDPDSTSQDASMSQDTASSLDELHTPRDKVQGWTADAWKEMMESDDEANSNHHHCEALRVKRALFQDDEPSSTTYYTSCENPGKTKAIRTLALSKKPASTRNCRLNRQNALEALTPATRSPRKSETPLED